MSFEISWYIPQRVIYVHVLGELGLAEVEGMSKRIAELLEAGIEPVHILLDDTKGGRPPLNLRELKARIEMVNHPIIGWVVGIGEVDAVAKFLIPLLLKIMSMKYTRVANVDEAVEFLSVRDRTLTIP